MKEIKDFEKWYKKINASDDEDDYLEFVWELMETPFTEYHYSLMINKNTHEEFKDVLWSRFDEHDDAEMFLLDKLEHNADTELVGKILFHLGEIVDLGNGKQKVKVYEYAKKYANDKNDNIRENAIIVLGWIGKNADLPLLIDHLLHDTNNKCRAWSASSFMQMNFHLKSFNVKIVYPAFQQAIEHEKDNFALATCIISLQDIAKKKWLSSSAAQNLEVEKIEKAKKSALNFLLKYR
jgi:hypothetical protein